MDINTMEGWKGVSTIIINAATIKVEKFSSIIIFRHVFKLYLYYLFLITAKSVIVMLRRWCLR